MSFIDQNDCMNVVESLIKASWPLDFTNIKFPFQRMSFNECMTQYGIDKPDLRFDMKFTNVKQAFHGKTGSTKLDSLVAADNFSAYAFKIPLSHDLDTDKIEKEYRTILKNVFHKSTDSHLFFILNKDSGNNISKYLNSETKENINKVLSVNNELVVLMASNNEKKLLEILGKYRLRVADLIDETNRVKHGSNVKLLRDPNVFKFLWVVDFPLFSLNEETNKLESTHHPFTAPINEHLELVKQKKDLETVIGQHYDLVVCLFKT